MLRLTAGCAGAPRAVGAGRRAFATGAWRQTLVEYADDKKLILGPTVEDLQDLANAAVRREAIANFRQARALLRDPRTARSDEQFAMRLLESAASSGMPEAACDLGLLLYSGKGRSGAPSDKIRAFQLFEFAAEGGVGKAAHNIGFMLHRGDGVAQNKARAAEFFEMAANQGVSKSAKYLGVMFQTGDGVARDLARAKQWFACAESAAAAKRARAQPASE